MRYLLMTILVCVLSVVSFAEEIEFSTGFVNSNPTSILSNLSPVFAGKGETTLQQSDDSLNTIWGSNNCGRAQWFEAPFDCHIIRTAFYYRYGNGTTKDITVWTDSGGGSGSLPDTVLGFVNFAFTNHSDYAWQDPAIDLTSLDIVITSGTKFWVGFPKETGNTMYVCTDSTDPDYGYAYDTTIGWSWYSSGELMLRVVINDDTDGPVAAAQDPADGDSGVSVDTDILFDIDDADIGVDSSTIIGDSVVVTDDTKAVVSGQLDVDDTDPNNVHVSFDPDSDFPNLTEVTVTVSPSGNKITDDLGNEMAEDSWTFTVIASGVDAASLGEIKAKFK